MDQLSFAPPTFYKYKSKSSSRRRHDSGSDSDESSNESSNESNSSEPRRRNDLPLEGGGRLSYLKTTPELYYQKVNMLYGLTGTGKTIVMLEAMKLLSDRIPLWFVISPTNKSNNMYTNRVPNCCIMTEIDIEFLEILYKRQEYMMEIYQKVNQLSALKEVFKLCADNTVLRIIKGVKRDTKKRVAAVKRNKKLDIGTMKGHIKAIKLTRDEGLKTIYKITIDANRKKLLERKLTPEQEMVVTFLNINPNVGLILDDTGAEVDKYKKKEVVKKFFYQGRHEFATVFFLFQDDKEIAPPLRKNPRTSVFTTEEVALGFFGTKTNGVTKELERRAEKVIKACFEKSSSGVEHHRKLVYQRGTASPFSYIVAENYEHDDFKVGADALWEFSKKLPIRSKSDASKTNPFIAQYVSGYSSSRKKHSRR